MRSEPRAEAATRTASRPAAAGAWYVAITLCVVHAVATLDRYIIVLATEPLRMTMRLTDLELGLLQGTGFAILYCCLAVPLGSVADLVHRRNLIALGITLWSLSTIACAFATSFGQLFAARIAVGFGEACLIPAAMSLLAAYFPQRTLARGVSVFGLGVNIGQATAFVGGAAFLTLGGAHCGFDVPLLCRMEPWRLLFVAAGLAALPALALLAGLREPPRARAAGSVAGAILHLKTGLAYLRDGIGRYAPCLVVGAMVAGIGYAFVSWSASLLVRVHGATAAEAGSLVGTIGLAGGPIGMVAGGFVLDRLQRSGVVGAPLVHMTGAAVAVLVAIMLFLLAPDIGTASVALGLILILAALMMVPLYVGIQLLTEQKYRGIAASFNMMVYTSVGLGLGPVAVGFVSDLQPPGASGLGRAMLIVVSAMTFVAVAVTLRYRHAFAMAADRIASRSA